MPQQLNRTFALVFAAALTACGGERADLVLTNGRIVTVDSAHPEAQAIAMKGRRIVAVGSNEEIQRYVGGNTEVIDLKGMLAVPGLIEGHGHFLRLGQAKMELPLGKARNWDDIVGMVAGKAKESKPGDWVLGRGWHQEKWDKAPPRVVGGMPTLEALSAVSPNNPVYLTHASGHASFANAVALDRAGITNDTKNPPGGEIVRDRSGKATGALLETAQGLVSSVLAKDLAARPQAEIDAENQKKIEFASGEAISKGIASFQDAGANFAQIDLFKKYASEGRLPVRLYVMVRREPLDSLAKKLPQYRMIEVDSGHLTVRSIKRQVDGALGSYGAWLLAPYDDKKESSGLVLEPLDTIRRTAELAIQHGYQLNTHAIGDRGNREILDLYEQIFKANPGKTDLRWRIEHSQHIDPVDIPRFGKLGVIAAMQGVHATSDAPWVYKRLGAKRAEEGAYMWQSLMKSGAVIANGTDAPVEDVDPIASFFASVSRRTADGSVFFPAQRMSREEALRSYTINNAFAAFEEKSKGSLTPGKWADVTVLSKDIMTVPENEILDAKVAYTIIGGKIVFRADTVKAGGM